MEGDNIMAKKGKLKSQIPWNNYAMRKHGVSIHNNLLNLGVRVNSNMMTHGTIKRITTDAELEAKMKADLEMNKIFETNQVGTC
jgi:hypothetical protein